MLSLSELKKYFEDTDGMNFIEANRKFSDLSEADQRKWADSYAMELQSRLSGYPAQGLELDLTHIAFSWRLLKKAHARKGPHKRIKGKPYGCYENCFAMVNENTSIYTGYARNVGKVVLESGEAKTALMWVRHAWLENSKKQIVETTPHKFSAYFGIEIDPETLWYLITVGVSEAEAKSLDGIGDDLPKNFSQREKYDFKMPGQH